MSSVPREDLAHILRHTSGVWEELRGARIFITGGTGFFGCWLLESFCHANEQLGLGARIVVLTRSVESFQQKAPYLASRNCVELVEGDVKNFVFPKGEFSHVIHAATETHPPSGQLDPISHFEGNLKATNRVIDFCQASGARKFLFTSSGASYGSQPAEMTHVPETYFGCPSPLDLNSAYGQSKRVSEFLCAGLNRNKTVDVTIARCFAFAGPHLPLDASFAIGNFVRDALKGGPIRIGGDGTPWRSYLYAADLAIWLWTILIRGQAGQAYNVGSDADLTIAELAKVVTEVVSPEAEVIIAQQPDPSKPAARYVPSIERARTELGLEPWIDLRESIRRMAEWNTKNK